MENTPYLYETLLQVLGQHAKWLDLRHRQTLAWMMVGLISAKTVSLGAWAPFVVSRARYAQSIVRRFRRWLDNNRIKPEPLYGPLIAQALVGWVGKRVYVALDTSMLWNTYCLIRLSVIYRGRAVPFVWQTPDLAGWSLMLATGLLAGAGHYCIINAFKRAPASVLAPFSFTQLIWATALGYLIFGDLPDGATLLGAVIIVGSGLYVFYRESIRRGAVT